MRAKLLVVAVSIVLVAATATVISMLINYGFGKDLNMRNVLIAALVCTPVITLFVGKQAFDFYKEEVAPKARRRGWGDK